MDVWKGKVINIFILLILFVSTITMFHITRLSAKNESSSENDHSLALLEFSK
jgi:hypothetical protein